MYTISSSNSICFNFYFYINYTARLLAIFCFSSNFVFRKNAYREGVVETNDRAGGRFWRMSPRVEAREDQDLCARLHDDPLYGMQMKRSVTMISLLLNKRSRKACLLINYQAIDSTWTIENRLDYPTASQALSLRIRYFWFLLLMKMLLKQ